MTVGTELRQAREREGLSAKQISERTKIQLYRVDALENGNFELLPQGIYLDGIVRAYAHELGLPHEPLIERVRLERGTLPGDWPIPFAVPIDLHPSGSPEFRVLDVTDRDEPLDSFVSERELGPRVSTAPAQRHAKEERARPGLTLLALVAAAGVGMYLYQTTPFLEREATASPVVSTTRAAVPVPYTESSVPPEVNTPVASDGVTGAWRLATQVESSSYRRFAGLTLGYEMQLEQEGGLVKGVGRKVTENGASVGPRAQTPLTVSGTIDGGRLMLNFVERGTRRPTEGQFVLLMDESGALRGRFSSSAARSSGRVEAHRVSTQ